jgi:hypothetical protein
MQYRRYRFSKKYKRKQLRRARLITDIKAFREMFGSSPNPIEKMMDYLNEIMVENAQIILNPEPVRRVTYYGKIDIN